MPKIQRVFKKNLEFFFLLLAIIITIFSVRIYNVNKNVINQNYINLINNTYFQKSINHVFDNLKPKFHNITHKVLKGETFNNILNKYNIPQSEIHKITKNFPEEDKGKIYEVGTILNKNIIILSPLKTINSGEKFSILVLYFLESLVNLL